MFCYEFDYTTYTLHLMTNVTSSLFHRVKVGKQGLALSLLPLRTNGAPTALNGKRVLSGERCILFVPPPVNVLEWGTTLILSKLTECVLCRLGNSKFPQNNILISAPGVTPSTRLVTWPESDIGCLDRGGGWSVVCSLRSGGGGSRGSGTRAVLLLSRHSPTPAQPWAVYYSPPHT